MRALFVKLISYSLIFFFTLYAFAPVTFAQTNSKPTANSYKLSAQTLAQQPESTNKNTSVKANPSSSPSARGVNEKGQVLISLCDLDPTGLCNTAENLLGGLLGSIGDLLGKILSSLLDLGAQVGMFFLDFVIRIILYITHAAAAALGFDSSGSCTAAGGGDAFADPNQQVGCEKFLAKLSTVDPLLATKMPDNLSLMTLADGGIHAVYKSIPSTNPVQYLAYEFQDNIFGIKPAYAQGIGTTSLGFIREFWTAFRNLAYILMTIAMIALGFLIMIRKQLSGRVTVTVFNSLPRVALALILITFSFAISGLFIDLIWVTVSFVRN